MNRLESGLKQSAVRISLAAVSLFGLVSCANQTDVSANLIDCDGGKKTGIVPISNVHEGEIYEIFGDHLRINKSSLTLLPASSFSQTFNADEITNIENGLTWINDDKVLTATLELQEDQEDLLIEGECKN